MSITITDPALLAQLAQVSTATELKAPDGRVIGTLLPEGYGKLPPGVKSPISDEEFEKARQSPDSGVPLAEFWKRVQAGEWK